MRALCPAAEATQAYTLEIAFAPQDLTTIRAAGEAVVILRSSAAGIQVVWLAFNPYQNNVVQWNDTFQLYASQTPLVAGSTLTPVATVSQALARHLYPFSNGMFGPPQSASLPQGQVEVQNAANNGGSLTFGLAQSASINGTPSTAFSPVSAQLVPTGQAGFFDFTEELTVMLRSQTHAAEVIDYVPVSVGAQAVAQSAAITLRFSSANATQSIQYDGANGTFVPS